jgi:hypothetical protein
MDHLALYSRRCKICKSLDPEEEREFPQCHFEQGNTECPAQEVQFAVVGRVIRYGKDYQKAQIAGNLAEQSRLLELVAKKSQAFQFKFNEFLSKK